MKIAKVQTNLHNFFYHWVRFIEPFHGLGKTEKKVLAELLYYRYLLSQEVRHEKLLNKLLFDNDIREKICNHIDIPRTRLTLIISLLKKANIIEGNTINKNFVPDLSVGDNEFVLAFKFKINGNEKGVYSKEDKKETRRDSNKRKSRTKRSTKSI